MQKLAKELEKAIMIKLSDMILKKKEELGISIREIGEKSGISYVKIYDIVYLRAFPKIQTLIKLGLALGYNYEEFMADMKKEVPVNFDLRIELAKQGYERDEIEEIIDFMNFIKKKKNKN